MINNYKYDLHGSSCAHENNRYTRCHMSPCRVDFKISWISEEKVFLFLKFHLYVFLAVLDSGVKNKSDLKLKFTYIGTSEVF